MRICMLRGARFVLCYSTNEEAWRLHETAVTPDASGGGCEGSAGAFASPSPSSPSPPPTLLHKKHIAQTLLHKKHTAR